MISKSEMKTYFIRANCHALRNSFKHDFHETTYFRPTFCIHCTGLVRTFRAVGTGLYEKGEVQAGGCRAVRHWEEAQGCAFSSGLCDRGCEVKGCTERVTWRLEGQSCSHRDGSCPSNSNSAYLAPFSLFLFPVSAVGPHQTGLEVQRSVK